MRRKRYPPPTLLERIAVTFAVTIFSDAFQKRMAKLIADEVAKRNLETIATALREVQKRVRVTPPPRSPRN